MPHKQMSLWCGHSLCKIFPEIHCIKPGEYFDTLQKQKQNQCGQRKHHLRKQTLSEEELNPNISGKYWGAVPHLNLNFELKPNRSLLFLWLAGLYVMGICCWWLSTFLSTVFVTRCYQNWQGKTPKNSTCFFKRDRIFFLYQEYSFVSGILSVYLFI